MWNETTNGDEVLNELCDADSLWGPLMFLRPARDKYLTSARLLLICSLFSFFYGMCANAVLAFARHCGGRPVPPVYMVPLFLGLTSYLCGELTFARAWNRRARLLNRRSEWSEANRRTPPPQ